MVVQILRTFIITTRVRVLQCSNNETQFFLVTLFGNRKVVVFYISSQLYFLFQLVMPTL